MAGKPRIADWGLPPKPRLEGNVAETSPGRRRRPVLIFAGLLLIVSGSFALAPILALGLPGLFSQSCGCAAPPTSPPPGWTPTPPPPISISRAEEIASAFMGAPMRSQYGDWTEFDGQPVLVTTGPTSFAYVDGNTGAVLAAFFVPELLSDAAAAVSAEEARQAAADFLARAGVSADGMTAAVQPRTTGGLPYFDVSWTAGGASSPAFEALVNASSGRVLAYRDLRSAVIETPIIGWSAAKALAEASPLAGGEIASEGGLDNLLSDGPHWTWQVGFNDGVLSVDAVTGEVRLAKWAR
jgi:hypothetical protein